MALRLQLKGTYQGSPDYWAEAPTDLLLFLKISSRWLLGGDSGLLGIMYEYLVE